MSKVAVIMAAYRAERYIEEAASSVLEQELPEGMELELRIGVDACGATANLLTDLGFDFWMSQAELPVGPYVIRNSLIQNRLADHYVIFDADDTMHPTYVRTLVNLAGDLDIGGCARYSVNEGGRRLGAEPHPFVSGVCCIPHAVWTKLGGYRPWPFAADWELVNRAKHLGVRIRATSRPLYNRRIHAASLTQDPVTGRRSAARNALVEQGHRHIIDRELHVDPVVVPLEWKWGASVGAPGHTDLMVAPEDIDSYFRENGECPG